MTLTLYLADHELEIQGTVTWGKLIAKLSLIHWLILFLFPDWDSFVHGLRVLVGAEVAHEVRREYDYGSIEATYIANQREKCVGSSLVDFWCVAEYEVYLELCQMFYLFRKFNERSTLWLRA